MFKEIAKKVKEKKSFTKEENDYLFMMYHSLDDPVRKEEMKDMILLGNIGLIWYVMKKINVLPYLKEDYYQEAFVALLEAFYSYDISKGITFSSYACRVISNHLYEYKLNYDHAIRLPQTLYRKAKNDPEKYNAIIAKFRPSYIEELFPHHLAAEVSLDERMIRNEELMALKNAIDQLPEEDRDLLFERYYMKDMTYEKIAKKHKKNISYVYRRLKTICDELQKMLE